jgi:hypothetical protein
LQTLARVLSITVLLVLCAAVARASGIPGHVYSASRMLAAYPFDDIRKLINDNLPYYLAGAAGPDIAFVASDPKDRSSAGAESHYERTGDLCINLLREARTDQERAFALGWMTHWVTDVHIHTLVNAYGGNWEQIANHHRHSQLEVVEVKHVYALRSGGLGMGELTLDSSLVPVEFMNRAFAATYDKEAFRPRILPDGTTKAPLFETLLGQAALFIQTSTQYYKEACESGAGKAKSSLMGLVLGTFQAEIPSNQHYQDLLVPLAIAKPTSTGGELVARVTIKDTHLFGKFLAEWPKFMEGAEDYSEWVFRACQEYIKDPTDTEAMAHLRMVLPNIDLDNPARVPDMQEKILGSYLLEMLADGTLRGDPDVQDLYLQYTIENESREAKVLPRVPIGHLPQSGPDKGRQGEVDAAVPLEEGRKDYRIGVSLGGPEAIGKDDFEGLEWAAATASAEAAIKVVGPFEVLATDVFALRAELPAGWEGRVKWFRWRRAGWPPYFYTVPVNNHGPLTFGQFMEPWGPGEPAEMTIQVEGCDGPDGKVLISGDLTLKVRRARFTLDLPARWSVTGGSLEEGEVTLEREPEEANPEQVRLFTTLSFHKEANFRPDAKEDEEGAGMDESSTELWPRLEYVLKDAPRVPLVAGELKGVIFEDDPLTCAQFPRVGYLAKGMFRVVISCSFRMNFLMGGPEESRKAAWEERKRAAKELMQVLQSVRIVEAGSQKRNYYP